MSGTGTAHHAGVRVAVLGRCVASLQEHGGQLKIAGMFFGSDRA